MLEDVRNYVRAGIGAVASQSADAIPGALASKAQSLAEQFASFAAGFLEWSGEARASLVTELKLLVAGQIQEMGLASQEDMERLTARVRDLEGRARRTGRASGRSSPAWAKKASAKKASAKTGSASGRKRQTPPKSSTRKRSSSATRSRSASSSRSSAGRGRSA